MRKAGQQPTEARLDQKGVRRNSTRGAQEAARAFEALEQFKTIPSLTEKEGQMPEVSLNQIEALWVNAETDALELMADSYDDQDAWLSAYEELEQDGRDA